jgi:RNA polymerase sigma-70 factor (ECF subfamily)
LAGLPVEAPLTCYKNAGASTKSIVSGISSGGPAGRDELYATASREFGRAIDRLSAGYEADPEKRHDLRQEIHLQLWRSLAVYDGRCSLKTWTFRVAHNTAATYVQRERRTNRNFVSLEQIERTLPAGEPEPDIDQQRALEFLSAIIRRLKPLDRQIVISYLEELDTAAIAEITGLTAANVRMKMHRIRNILSARFQKEKRHA